MIVREYERNADFDGMRACLIELQEFERRIDPRKPAGNEMATAYISDALSKCAECHGKIFVAVEEGEIAGYATVLARVRSGTLDDGDLELYVDFEKDLAARAGAKGAADGQKRQEA